MLELAEKHFKAAIVSMSKDLKENMTRTLFDITHSKIFFKPSRIMEIKKRNKGDLTKRESFCTAKEAINKMKT